MDDLVEGPGDGPARAAAHAPAPGGDPVAAARHALAADGLYVMPAAAVSARLGTDSVGWTRFGSHWNDLSPDRYAARAGTCRLRRYGHFSLSREGRVRLLPHGAFVQPHDTNPLFVDVDRHFDPLTQAFVDDPLLLPLLRLLGETAAALDDAGAWSVKVHPFRVVSSAGGMAEPTPEGRHRDGVTLVSSLLISRRNATGGASTVYDPQGRELRTVTLTEPGTLLLGDDRTTLHSVTPVTPHDPGAPACRDVLVVTLTAR